MSSPVTAVRAKAPLVGSTTSQGIVVVQIGPDREKHQVHKVLLMHHSKYFRKALVGSWKEATEQVVKLEDVESSTFRIFVHWIYTQELPRDQDGWADLSVVPPSNDYWMDYLMSELVKAYVFGDRFLAPEFCRAVNNASVKHTPLGSSFFDEDGCFSIDYAFKNIRPSSVLLQHLVDMYCTVWREDADVFDESAFDKLPNSFIRRVIQRLKNDDHRPKKKCCYLEHASEQEKENCLALHINYDKNVDIAYFQ
ncbi:hypothetical protein HBI15_034300 [Parastagonospora nodorum]|nr:hypothetical protein HBI15_034300 [Parastagonospora nodorum]